MNRSLEIQNLDHSNPSSHVNFNQSKKNSLSVGDKILKIISVAKKIFLNLTAWVTGFFIIFNTIEILSFNTIGDPIGRIDRDPLVIQLKNAMTLSLIFGSLVSVMGMIK
ncbi:MAG: hypothetical protein Q8K60_09630 [Parachlamydiaceae bacterium]|nr:hypothetical protein [Parachlamydiaceae bacterium]